MICGIYKITNTINGKCYIGQSRNIEKRWIEHKNRPYNKKDKSYNYPFYRAIRQYGLKNFTFEVLEECSIEELNEREKYWISVYNSFDKNYGYNLTRGGDCTIPLSINNGQVQEIISLLKTTMLSQQEIADKYNVSQRTISSINIGETWRMDDEIYPLRSQPIPSKEKRIQIEKIKAQGKQSFTDKNGKTIKIKENAIVEELKYCVDCGKPICLTATRCPSCDKIHQRKVKRPSREKLKQEIRATPFIQLGKKYNVSDNAVRNWCDYYGLPRKKTDIKKYTDQEWEEV